MMVAVELMKEWPGSGCILKAEATEFTDRLGIRCKRMKTIKENSQDFRCV